MDVVHRFAKREQGTSLIEMMIAMVVLTVGLLGSMALPMMSISGNSRNRWDSTGTIMAEMAVDQISSIPVGASSTSVTVTDCAGNSHTLNSAGTSTGAGANLSGGGIDFTQSSSSITSGYSMMYTVCGNSTGTQSVYDVRWNVQTIRANYTNFVTVAARRANWSGSPQLFAIPVSLRTVVGNAGF
jgi:prepilin-type N-terminal cleavage/methylation domain-containing protein